MKRFLPKTHISPFSFPFLSLFFLLTISSCKKIVEKETAAKPLSQKFNSANALPVTPNGYCVTDQENL